MPAAEHCPLIPCIHSSRHGFGVANWRHAALAVATWMATMPSHALQVVEARDGVAVEAIVSSREPTRIRIEGAPVTDVFGNIHSSHCPPAASNAAPATVPLPAPAEAATVNPLGEIVLECDRDKGEIYVRPVQASGKPINLFLSSPQATYTLLLRRADTPADTILIRDPQARLPAALASPSDTRRPSEPHVRAMKAMLVAMASGSVPQDIHVEELGQAVQLWAESRLTLLRRYEGRGLLGEQYRLQNTGAQVMVLTEQEFDRDGGDIVGVSIEHHQLRPGESTRVFVLRRELTP